MSIFSAKSPIVSLNLVITAVEGAAGKMMIRPNP
jgi:hypothetical protein